MTAAAYIRKSKVEAQAGSGSVSREAQEEACRRLAARDGYEDVTVYIDWNRSGDEDKADLRDGYNRLLADIGAGAIRVVYAMAQDRLMRGLAAMADLMKLCERKGVTIVTDREGIVGGDGSPMARAASQMTAVMAEAELNIAKARAKAAATVRRRRGDHMGALPYGFRRIRLNKPGTCGCGEHTAEAGAVVLEPDPGQPVKPILEAWERSERRVRRAVRILNDEMGLRTARGRHWDRPSLLRLIAREAPDRLPARTATGRRQSHGANLALSKLLRCWCGRLMSPNVNRDGISWYCSRGMASRADHMQVYISQRRLLPWIREEAGRLRVPAGQVEQQDQNDGDRAELESRRGRVVEAFMDGDVSREAKRELLTDIDRRIEALDVRTQTLAVPQSIEWETWKPEAINAVLRSMWHHVELGDDLLPVQAEWTVPEWRADEA